MMRARGFTLIEVLVAIGIIGFALISLLTLLPVGLRSTRLAGDFTTAAFLAQQELDQIRARAQVRDFIDTDGDGVQDPGEPFESGFDPDPALTPDQRNNNGLGYFDLPFSLEKGTIASISVPNQEALQSETFTITMTSTGVAATFDVVGDKSGCMGSGAVGTPFTSWLDANCNGVLDLGDTDDRRIAFLIRDNANDNAGAIFPAPNDTFRNYPADPTRSDVLVLKVEVINNVWYAYWAARQNVSEDRTIEGYDLLNDNLDNDGDGTVDDVSEDLLDGVLTGVVLRDTDTFDNDNDGVPDDAGEMGIVEDTGIDLVPNFFDRNFNRVQDPDEPAGETGYDPGLLPTNVNDPHGDDGPAGGPGGDPITGRGTEGNGQLDALPANQIQRVTVTVFWREGGRDRSARFSTNIANPFL